MTSLPDNFPVFSDRDLTDLVRQLMIWRNKVVEAVNSKGDETAASGTFTTVDSKTVTVVNGIITSIV